MAEVRSRGFQTALNAGQVIIFCNRKPVRRLTDPIVPDAAFLQGKRAEIL